MEMMKKLAILVAAIILGWLGYAGCQHYAMQQSDSVKIQKCTWQKQMGGRNCTIK